MHCTPFHSLPSCTRFFPPLFSSILSFFSFSYPSPISSLPLTLLLPQVQGGVAEWDYEGDRDDERTLQDDPPAQPFGVASKKNGRQVLTKVQCGRFILLFLPFYYHEFSSRCISMYLTESVMSCKSCHFIHHETLHHSSIPYITPHHYPPSSVSPPSLPRRCSLGSRPLSTRTVCCSTSAQREARTFTRTLILQGLSLLA